MPKIQSLDELQDFIHTSLNPHLSEIFKHDSDFFDVLNETFEDAMEDDLPDGSITYDLNIEAGEKVKAQLKDLRTKIDDIDNWKATAQITDAINTSLKGIKTFNKDIANVFGMNHPVNKTKSPTM